MRHLMVIVGLLLAAPAAAEDAASAMKSFGLLGSWATDCSIDVQTRCVGAPPGAKDVSWKCGGRTLAVLPVRVVFAAPAGGPPTRTTTQASFVEGVKALTAFWTVQSAALLEDDKIVLRMTFVDDDGQRPAGVPAPDDKGVAYDLILRKKDGRIRNMDFVRVDGSRIYAKDGHIFQDSSRRPWETPSYERCDK